jgi:uncharacterized protein (TIGR03435 family)
VNLKKAGVSVALVALFATARVRAQVGDDQGAMGIRRPPGIFGPVSVHLKAGDPAPDLVYTGVLHTPDSSALGASNWSASNLLGKITVIVFFPLVSQNPQAISMWNAAVDRFRDKPIQFVLIAGEQESTLRPYLKEHPVNGWVLHDPQGQTGRAYGLEMPVMVIVGADQKIIGFSKANVPDDQTLNAVLEGRIQTEPVGPTKAERMAFMTSHKVLLDAEPWRMPGFDDHKPAFAPSNMLHVSLSKRESGGGNFTGDDYWSREGYTLKSLIAEIYETNPIRVALPASLDDNKRYDFALVFPQRTDRDAMNKIAQQGIEDYFHITATRERRLVDVYVVTTADGRPPLAKVREDEGMGSGFGASGVDFVSDGGADDLPEMPMKMSLSALRGFSFEGVTMEQFCRQLESNLDRPLVDETELKGRFDFELKADRDPNDKELKNDFAQHLREQLHLAITPAQRTVETLVFYPR